jgi:glycosyltransferase involved in cell wall biosynthesis
MSTILTITDSLSASAGGLAHASIQLAIAVSEVMSEDRHILLCQQDHDELDHGMLIPQNLCVVKHECYRNSFYPLSLGLAERLCSFRPDVVHLRGLWRQSSLACLAWKQLNPGKPLIVQTAGMLEPWAIRRNGVIKQLYYHAVESRLIRESDRIHATSTIEVNSLIHQGVPKSKIVLIEEGVRMPQFQFVSQRIDDNSPKTLLFLSRLHPVKGLDLLLEALSLLRPRDWRCVIAGMGDSGYLEALNKKVQQYNLGSMVVFSGPLLGAEKEQAFMSADAFILPSYSESFGIAIAEAMSWGLPVITTQSTPWSVILEQNMGWYVDSSLSGITEALFGLMNASSSFLSQMGERGRRYVESRYSWSAVGPRMSRVYRSLI